MDSIISRGRRALDSFIGREPPPDDILETCKKHLTMLVKSIDHVEQKFEKYASCMVGTADAGRLVGNDVMNFYKKASTRHKQAHACNQVESHLQSLSMSIWKEDYHEYESVAANFSDWKYEVNELRDKLKQAELLRTKAYNRKEKISSLEGKKPGVSMSNVFSTESDNSMKIKNEKEVYSQEIKEYKLQRVHIQKCTQKFLNERFEKFDKIFMRFMELQMLFFSQANSICKKFKPFVDTYRRKFPSTRSAGDLGDPEEESESDSEDSSDEDDDDEIHQRHQEGVMTMKNPPKKEKVRSPPSSTTKKKSNNNSPAEEKKKEKIKKARPQSPPEQEDLLGFGDFSQPTKPAPTKKKNKPIAKKSKIKQEETNDDPFGLFSAPISKKDPTKNASFPAPSSNNSSQRPSTTQQHNDLSDFNDFDADFSFPAPPANEKSSSTPTTSSTTNKKKMSNTSNSTDDPFEFFTSPVKMNKASSVPKKKNSASSNLSDDPFSMFSASTVTQPVSKPTSKKSSPNSNSSSNPESRKRTTSVVFDPLSSNFQSAKKEDDGLKRKDGDGRYFHEELPDDPELRAKVLKAQKEALDEMHRLQEIERREASIREQAQTQVKNVVDQWEFEAPNQRKKIRKLLASVHTVLDFPGSNWKKVGLTDLVNAKAVKRAYRKSMKIVHPDQTGRLNPQQKAKAERVFRALTEEWTAFQTEKQR